MHDPEIIVVTSKNVMPRFHTECVLLYHTRTDEMHVVSYSVYELFKLCNGGRTYSEIVNEVVQIKPEFKGEEGLRVIDRFLDSLVERQLVELWS